MLDLYTSPSTLSFLFSLLVHCVSCLFFNDLFILIVHVFLTHPGLSLSIFLSSPGPLCHPLSLSLVLSLSSPLSLSLPGRLYYLLNQYSSLMCRNCQTMRPDVNLYSFIFEKVSTPAAADAPDSKDSGMSPLTSDSH